MFLGEWTWEWVWVVHPSLEWMHAYPIESVRLAVECR